MRLPRFRVTVRGMMLAVAIVAAGVWWFVIRPRKFADLAAYHMTCFADSGSWVQADSPASRLMQARLMRRALWHREMAMKYRDAARRPWLPVAPDPPEPE